MKYAYTAIALLATLTTVLPVAGQDMNRDMRAMHVAGAAAQDAMPKVSGEIRKVDVDAGKITIRHGEIPNLDMPAMTMVFRAASPDMLNQVKTGDQVLFTAEKNNGALTVTTIEVLPPK